MRCDKIQELVLTDYLDGELAGEQLRAVEDHLAACGQCREFAHHARKATVDPLEQLERIEPSARLWQNIQEAIAAEAQADPAMPVGFWEGFRRLFPAPRPAFVLAALVVAVVLSLTLIPRQTGQNSVVHSEGEEQIEYLAALVEVTMGSAQDANGGYGTVIEEYFL